MTSAIVSEVAADRSFFFFKAYKRWKKKTFTWLMDLTIYSIL